MAWLEFLSVLPNPWTHIDSDGRTYADPAGFVLHDPAIFPPETQQRVGASVATVKVLHEGRIRSNGRAQVVGKDPIQRTRYQYVSEPILVHNNAYYRKEVAQGHLIAADVDTARACQIKPEDFRDPHELLAELREVKIAEFLAENPDAPLPSFPITDAIEAVEPSSSPKLDR